MITKIYYDTKNISYKDMPFYNNFSIFLAGPTDRTKNTQWRIDALEILEDLGGNADLNVIIPEFEYGHGSNKVKLDYDEIIDWEQNYLNSVYCILFWIPRELKTLPGFTTNVEFGMYAMNNEMNTVVVCGSPKNADKIRYLQYLWENIKENVWHTSLESALHECLLNYR